MTEFNCNVNTFLLVIIVVLIVAFTDNIFRTVPLLKKLFTDPINYMLLIILVIILILIDMKNGIIIAFLVLYISVYLNQNKKNSERKVRFTNVETIILPQTMRSESEFIYNNSKPFPNKNLKPFQSTIQEEHNNSVPITTKPSNDPEYITNIGLPNRDSYDIVGCRYDFKNSLQNLTKYGPPLSQCGSYSGEQSKLTGTVFYPLNG